MSSSPASGPPALASLPDNARQALYERLKEGIYLGELRPGQHLVETSLATLYQVSRTPIREALVRLEQDGLVVRDNRGGLAVREHSPAEILDLYEMRILLETEAGRAAAERHTTHDLLSLRKAAKRYEAVPDDDARALVETNARFHEAVWRCTHQLALIDLLGRLEMHLGRFPTTTLTHPERRKETIEQHRAIVTAIEARDQGAAGEACGGHFRDARELRLKLWENED